MADLDHHSAQPEEQQVSQQVQQMPLEVSSPPSNGVMSLCEEIAASAGPTTTAVACVDAAGLPVAGEREQY